MATLGARNSKRHFLHDVQDVVGSSSPGVGIDETVSGGLLKRDSAFRSFVNRMMAIERDFITRSGPNREIVVIPYVGEDSDDEEGRKQWLDCCLRDYLDRKRSFEARFKTRRQLLVRVAAYTACFVALLWFLWPIWEVLIDVEADGYYKVLGIGTAATPSEIKKAYREQVKIWHPDRNPACGEKCRDQMIKLQQAHDVLLAKGDQRFELANRYREELSQLRSLVFFRIYQMAFGAAQAVYHLLVKAIPRSLTARESVLLSAGCKVAAMGFFTAYEAIFVSGFNFFMVVQVFFYCVTIAKGSAQEAIMDSMKKASYVDAGRESVAALSVLFFCNVVYIAVYGNRADVVEEVFQMCFGCLYVLAFLYRFTPNIFDNFLMRKCSIPLTYFQYNPMRFSWKSFAFSEGGFLVDDLFAFTCRVPSMYRATVYVIHFVFLCQFALLPWDSPVRSNLEKKMTADGGARESAAEPKSRVRETPQVAEDTNRRSGVPAAKPLSDDEMALVADLDGEEIHWKDLVFIKYKHIFSEAVQQWRQRSNRQPVFADIVGTSDFQNVAVLVAYADGSAGPNNRIDVLQRFHDPSMSLLLARENPDRMRLPAGKPAPPSQPPSSTATPLDAAQATVTMSQLWRGRVSAPSLAFGSVFNADNFLDVALLVVCGVVLVVVLCVAPTSLDAAKVSRGLPKVMRPLLVDRFGSILPPEHILNEYAAGLLSVRGGGVVVCSPDTWDAIRTLP